MRVQPFSIDVSQVVLDDLQRRLATTRWPDETPGSGWDYGTDLGYLKELVEYWRTEFDWRVQERTINNFDQFRAEIGGLGIHFIHERGKGPGPFPLVVSHGWPPGFLKSIGPGAIATAT